MGGSVLCLCGKGLGVSGLQEQLGGPLASSQGIRAVILPAGEFCIAKAQEDHVPVTAQRC